FGEPVRNYENAKRELCMLCGMHVYNRWKAGVKDNLIALIEHIQDEDASSFLLRPEEVRDVKALLGSMSDSDTPFISHIKSRFSYEGKRLFAADYIEEKSEDFLRGQLVSELNLILEGPSLYDKDKLGGQALSDYTTRLVSNKDPAGSPIELDRRLLEDSLWSYIDRRTDDKGAPSEQELTILDVILDEDIRDEFVRECQNLIVFGIVYDNLISDLVSVARQAHESRTISAEFVDSLLEKSLLEASALPVVSSNSPEEIGTAFALWIVELAGHSRCASFLKSVEEWNRIVHKDKSDTLFVVVSFFFEKLLPEYYAAQESGRRYEGKVEPVRIGRRKDFWNRLTIAYRDLLFHELLTREKRTKRTTYQTLLKKYVENFEPMNENLMSAEPVAFPTFRATIETALKNDVKPSGMVTGIGDFKTETGCYRVGLVITRPTR
ncbi:MAG: hypothetical protein WD994_02210, partial [Pseudomonadales bacterium]